MLTEQFKIAPDSDPKMRVSSGQTQSHGSTGVTQKMKSYKKKLIAGTHFLH